MAWTSNSTAWVQVYMASDASSYLTGADLVSRLHPQECNLLNTSPHARSWTVGTQLGSGDVSRGLRPSFLKPKHAGICVYNLSVENAGCTCKPTSHLACLPACLPACLGPRASGVSIYIYTHMFFTRQKRHAASQCHTPWPPSSSPRPCRRPCPCPGRGTASAC